MGGNAIQIVERQKKKEERRKKWLEYILQESMHAAKSIGDVDLRTLCVKTMLIEKGMKDIDADVAAKCAIYKQEKERSKRRLTFCKHRYLEEFNYYATFTYDENKLSEKRFKRKLLRKLKRFSKHKGWKYLGVWERTKESQRLYFYGLVYIPDKKLVGKFIKVNDFNFKAHKPKEVIQNTYFNRKFGRCTFEEINAQYLPKTMVRMVKHLMNAKDSPISSKNIPSSTLNDLSYTTFKCLKEGDEYIGQLEKRFKC